MAGQRVLIIDDNQIFGSQVVAAFTDVGLPATWVARGSQALSLLESEPVQLVIADLVRPASGGRWLLEQLSGQQNSRLSGKRPPLALALVPVIGTFHDLPEGVEVQVKPIFPTQVVASARRLLGMAPASSPSTGGPRLTPMSGPVATAPAIAQHRLPQTLPQVANSDGDLPTTAHSQVGADSLDEFEDSSDFGPADTLLVPLNIEELARAMTHSAPTGDDLLDSALIDSSELELAANSSDETSQLVPVRSRTRPQFMALKRPTEPAFSGVASSSASPGASSAADSGEHQAHLAGTLPVLTSPSAEALAQRAMLSQETNQLPRPISSPTLPPMSGGRGALLPGPIAAEARHLAAAATAASPALTGDLAVVPLIDVLALLARQRQSGMLRVFAEVASQPHQLTWTMTWTQGRLDQCTATGVSEPGPGSGPVEDLRIGRFILEAAALSHTQIEEVEARRQNQRAQRHRPPAVNTSASPESAGPQVDLLGLRLCKEGLLQPEELRQALTRQSTELLYTALRMKVGRFVFDNRELPPSQAIDPDLGGRLGLDTETLLLEGYRRVHDYHMLAKDAEEGAVYVSTTPSSSAVEKLSQLGLSEHEIIVLGQCSGRLSLGEIARESRIPLLDVARIIQRLLALRLCRRRLPALLAS